MLIDNLAALIDCTPLDRASDSMMTRPKAINFSWLGPEPPFVCCLVHRGSTDDLLLLQISSGVVWQTRDLHLSRNTLYLLSLSLLLHSIKTPRGGGGLAGQLCTDV